MSFFLATDGEDDPGDLEFAEANPVAAEPAAEVQLCPAGHTLTDGECVRCQTDAAYHESLRVVSCILFNSNYH